jgi:hypothetical protein
MAEFTARSDSINVEQIMEQIRARIREKRGVDYTEQQIREMAAVKLEKLLDPRGVRSDLLDQFRRAQPAYTPPELPNYAFEEETIYASHRAPLRFVRRLLQPVLKLLFNPNPLIQALNIQSKLNTMSAEREARREAARRAFDQLQYEVMHNLVVETTRMSIEVKNLKMRVESLAGRLEFNERRARALESVVAYRPSSDDRPAAAMSQADQMEQEPAGGAMTAPNASSGPAAGPITEGPGQRSRRRRRRRGRRGAPATAIMGQGQSPSAGAAADGAGPPSSPVPEADQRATRPEPFEQAFGAAAHSAEPVPRDPGPDPDQQ